MFKKLVPINRERHAKTLLREDKTFGFAKGLHVVYLTLAEFSQAAPIYPIVFVETEEGLSPMALLGLVPGENLFVDADGHWAAHYIPAIVRRYPFALATSGVADRFSVCVDEGSPLINASEGEPLFDADGEPTAVIDNVKRYLGELQQMDVTTKQFSTWLRSHDMLTPLRLNIRDQGVSRQVSGCLLINEEKLNGLSDTLFLELRHRHFLRAIYAHLHSLAQVERLVELSAKHRTTGSYTDGP